MAGSPVTIHPGRLRGRVRVPGDKSISHRALIAGAAMSRPLHVSNLNPGRDVRATRQALQALGVRIDGDETAVVVSGGGLRPARDTLNCMNSGSTARMLLGACAGAGVAARFDGDDSLRRRPMEPVAAQLRAFGARIHTTEGYLPVDIAGTPEIQTRHFILLAPSAQVKSALLFAGLFAGASIQIEGDRGSRDHTERLLAYLGAAIEWNARSARLQATALRAAPVEVPGDPSSAAFFIAAAAITPGSAIVVEAVGVNPTRLGLVEVLREMGAAIELRNEATVSGEPVANIVIEHRPLRGVQIQAEQALRAIDEIPLVAIAAAFASGATTIAGIADLRTKESDRIAATKRLLDSIGARLDVERATLRVEGGRPAGFRGTVETQGDHRIAMAAAVLARASGPLTFDGADSIEVSFPGFLEAVEALRG